MSAKTAIHMVAMPMNVTARKIALITSARAMFCLRILDVCRDNRMKAGILRKSSSISATSAVSMAVSVPAPALARAEIGFAMAAAGTDTAIETADVALMDDDLRKIPAFIRLSRQTSSILKQNIALALVIKAIFLAVTFMGMATMWMAVFADMGVSLLVVFNGLRLLRK